MTTTGLSPRFLARAAGVAYIMMTLIGTIPAIAGRVPASKDVAVMAANLLAHRTSVYAGFASDVFVVACYVPVTALWFELFKPVNRLVSLTAAFFGLVGCATQAVAALFRVAPLAVLTKVQSSNVAAVALSKLYSPAFCIAMVFFGCYLILIGWMTYRSTFLPRALGVLVMIAGFAGLTFVWPPLVDLLYPGGILPFFAGELLLVLWMLIRGVDEQRWRDLVVARHLA